MSEQSPDGGRFPHVMKAVTETSWAIRKERLATILEIVQLRASGGHLSDDEISARIGASSRPAASSNTATVAVLPLYGVIVPRADMFTQVSGATSVSGFQSSFRAALADPVIDGILIDIDSPGGSTDLVPELAAEVYDARGGKPIVAIANTMAASAAYWIGSQADEFVVTPSGEVGSIGVYAVHQDLSGKQEKEGVKTTLVKAGEFKADTNPYEPLSDEARAAVQERVDEFYGMFLEAVSRGRSVSVSDVKGRFGKGRVVTASSALKEGMVDGIATFDATVARMIRNAQSRSDAVAAYGASHLSFVDETERARTHAADLVVRSRSLADLREHSGRTLSAANRDRLTAAATSFAEAASALEELVAEPTGNSAQQVSDVLAELVRFERLRSTI